MDVHKENWDNKGLPLCGVTKIPKGATYQLADRCTFRWMRVNCKSCLALKGKLGRREYNKKEKATKTVNPSSQFNLK